MPDTPDSIKHAPEIAAELVEAARQAGFVDVAEYLKQLVTRSAYSPAISPLKPGEPRKGGVWKGLVHIANDFDELPPDLQEAFGMK